MPHDIRTRLHRRKLLLGTMITLPEPATAEMLASLGFDWLFVDAEHGPLETRELAAILRAAGDRTPCLVRVPEAAEVPIKKTLDLGAAGVIVPQVGTAEQAADVVRFARYSPEGARGVGLARAHGYGLAFQEYLGRANAEIAVVVQAESIRAVENIEAIVRVQGVDAVLLGPYDLSASLGRMGKIDDPAVVDAIEHVTKTCERAGMPLGYFGVHAAAVRPYVERGFTLIVAGVDTLLLGGAAKELLARMRALHE